MRLPQVTDREWRLIEPAPAAGPSPWQTAPGRSALCQRFLRRRSGACAALLGAHPRRQPRLEKLDTVFRSRRDPTAAGPRASWPLCRPGARARGLIDGQDARGLARNIESEWQACEIRLRCRAQGNSKKARWGWGSARAFDSARQSPAWVSRHPTRRRLHAIQPAPESGV
jgi:hypothetical protein